MDQNMQARQAHLQNSECRANVLEKTCFSEIFSCLPVADRPCFQLGCGCGCTILAIFGL